MIVGFVPRDLRVAACAPDCRQPATNGCATGQRLASPKLTRKTATSVMPASAPTGRRSTLSFEQLRGAGWTKVYRGKVTGAHGDRREVRKLLKSLAACDTVTVMRIDRLARSTFHLFGIVRRIVDAKAQFRSLAEPWADTGTSTGRLMLAVLGRLADVKRDLIRTRTAEGRSRAKAQGQQMGRPPGTFTSAQQKDATRGWRWALRSTSSLAAATSAYPPPRDESRMSSAAATIPALDPAEGYPTDAGGARDFLLCPVRAHVAGLDHGRPTAANNPWPPAPPSVRCTSDPQAATPSRSSRLLRAPPVKRDAPPATEQPGNNSGFAFQ
jgi:hypothetical protein